MTMLNFAHIAGTQTTLGLEWQCGYDLIDWEGSE